MADSLIVGDVRPAMSPNPTRLVTNHCASSRVRDLHRWNNVLAGVTATKGCAV